MLRHVVMWKFKEELNDIEKNDFKRIIKDQFESLQECIKEILSLSIGIDNEEFESNYDFVLITDFENINDLQCYQNHPEHLKVVEIIKGCVSKRTCVDYFI